MINNNHEFLSHPALLKIFKHDYQKGRIKGGYSSGFTPLFLTTKQRYEAGRSGFTLTELLIVVVIIGILATLAFPMLVKTLEKAKVGEATSNLNLIRTGQKIYFLEYGQFSPTIADLNIENPNDASSRYFYYEDIAVPDLTTDFKAQATRGGTGAISAPEPYQDDKYYVQKDGTIHGRFTTNENP